MKYVSPIYDVEIVEVADIMLLSIFNQGNSGEVDWNGDGQISDDEKGLSQGGADVDIDSIL